MIRYLIITQRTEAVIEAENLDHAEQKANERYPSWLDVRLCDITKGEEVQ